MVKDLLLYNKANPLIQKCLGSLDNGSAVMISPTGPTRTSELKDIYNWRIRADKDQPNRLIEGGEDLLKALDRETDEYIMIYPIESPLEFFLIFTDRESRRLIGVISVQKINPEDNPFPLLPLFRKDRG